MTPNGLLDWKMGSHLHWSASILGLPASVHIVFEAKKHLLLQLRLCSCQGKIIFVWRVSNKNGNPHLMYCRNLRWKKNTIKLLEEELYLLKKAHKANSWCNFSRQVMAALAFFIIPKISGGKSQHSRSKNCSNIEVFICLQRGMKSKVEVVVAIVEWFLPWIPTFCW